MKQKIIFLTLATFFISIAYSQTPNVKPAAEYTKIDSQENIMRLLKNEDASTVNNTVKSVLAQPNKYNPMVLYMVSAFLFEENKKDEAVFWYYTAQLRARYDSNLCLDKSIGQSVSYIGSMFGQEINPYAFENLTKLEATVKKVVAFVKENEEDYDHRWINLNGMNAMTESLDEKTESASTTKPKNEWAAIKQETIDTYYNGFKEALIQFKQMKK